MAVATERGIEEGAEVVTGGTRGEGKGAFYQPTVLAKVDNSMDVAQEEIFGPVGVLFSTSPKPFNPFGL